MEDTEAQQPNNAERLNIFATIQRIARDNPDANKRIVQVYNGSGLDSAETARLLEGKPYIDVKELEHGDALIISTQSGSQFYFYIENGVSRDNNYAKGDLRRIDKEGNQMDYADAVLRGSSLGSALAANRVFLDGLSVDFRIPSETDNLTDEEKGKILDEKGPEGILPKILRTSAVTNADVIKRETIVTAKQEGNLP